MRIELLDAYTDYLFIRSRKKREKNAATIAISEMPNRRQWNDNDELKQEQDAHTRVI